MFLLIKNLFILIHRKIMTYTLEEISTILKNEDKNAKILILSSQTKTSNPQIIRQVISSLNDNEI